MIGVLAPTYAGKSGVAREVQMVFSSRSVLILCIDFSEATGGEMIMENFVV